MEYGEEAKSQLTIFIVMEHFDTDLKQFINKKIKDLDDRQLLQLVKDCIQSIDFLHRYNVIHRDVKPANFLITSDLRVKIGDLGVSRCIPENY